MADDDDYNYEFDEDDEKEKEVNVNETKSGEDDEQKNQKMNQQLEALEEKIKKIEKENEQLKKSITEKNDEIEEMKAKQEEGGDELPQFGNLLAAIKSFADSNGLQCPVSNEKDITEDIAIQVLSDAQEKLQRASGRSVTSKSLANCSESELVQRVQNLEEELRLALGAAEDIRALKAKAIQLVERIRLEKEDRLKAEAEVRLYVKKIEMLSDHIEKLMIHLKHEAAAKIKAVDQLRGSERRNEGLKADFDLLSRKAAAKERLIAELREGSKILEDQLRLMDEKYLELRTKLDYAREVAGKKVRNAQKVASDLRVKFALAGNQKLLDHIPIPDLQDMSGDGMNFDSSQSMPTLDSRSASGRKKAKKKKKRVNNHVAQDPEQSTERVLDKIRRLRGGEQEWDEQKCRNLANTR